MPAPQSRRDLRRQQEFENELAQQGADQKSQAAMLQQLAALYDIGQQQQFAPEKLRALQADTAGREYETQYGAPARTAATQAGTAAQQYQTQNMLPAELEAMQGKTAAQVFENERAPKEAVLQDAYRQAQIESMHALSGQRNALPNTYPYLPEHLKRIEEERAYGPELKKQREAETQTKWGQIEGEARQGGLDEGAVMQQFGPENLEYLKGLVPPKTVLPRSNMGSLPPAILEKIGKTNEFLVPAYKQFGQIYDWLKQPTTR